MTSSLYISTTKSGSGKILIALGIIEYFLRKTTRIGFFRPIIPSSFGEAKDSDIDFILTHFNLDQTYEEAFAWRYREISDLMGHQKWDQILDRIISQYKVLEQKFDFILCEGSDYLGENSAFEFNLNTEIVKNLGCPSLILGNAFHNSVEDAITPIEIAFDAYRARSCPVAGIIINKVDSDRVEELKTVLAKEYADQGCLLAVIPYLKKLDSPKIKDIVEQLDAEVLYGHHYLDNLVSNYVIAAMQMQHALSWFQEDSLVVTPGDRGDMIVGALQANQSSNYPHLAGLLLSTGFKPESEITKLLDGLPDPLPILAVKTDTFTTATRLQAVYSTLKPTDHEKINLIIQLFDENIEIETLEQQISQIQTLGITPKMFTYNLVQQAKAQKRHIVLPEGKEPRILEAVSVLLKQEIVDITLLGTPAEIEPVIKRNGIQLAIADLKIIDPLHSDKLEAYTQTLFELRQHKGMTLDAAHDTMLDGSYFGTMMVYQGDADGMVSGAVHTTQHTIRPALQIIKTTEAVSIVSSVFFMCLDDGVVVYGDCAVNPNPTAEQLAEIALSSADTAKKFGIIPKIAFLSYSSGESGQGVDVEKVRKAAQIAQTKRPDLQLEGPIQYDAAVDPAVAAQKMPGSQVAGQASVFIFPDLNTGNNTYKAVQRETGAIAIGPILQGLRKPVNDLSRGCTVEDIINTVVITAIQSQ